MPHGDISGNCLLVSCASENTEVILHAMQQFAISGEACDDPEVALRLIQSKKYEAVVIDFQLGTAARQILREVRNSASNRRSVVFALVNENVEAAEAFVSGSSFTISKPVLEVNAVRLIRAAYGMILRERRRYFRCPMSASVRLTRADSPEGEAQSVNLSEGGISIVSNTPLIHGESIFIHFVLPGTTIKIACKTRVCWADSHGKAGLQIDAIDKGMKADLENWLARRLDEFIPAAVTSKLENQAPQIQ